MPPFPISTKPLLNSACLWASTFAELEALYKCPHTGAITTRTACHPTEGFQENESQHQHAFSSTVRNSPVYLADLYSVNTYGYSPLSLEEYISMVEELQRKHHETRKTIIFSVTGDSETVAQCWKMLAARRNVANEWCMEINLSCPNISNRPPPAYSKQELEHFLAELRGHISIWAVEKAETLEAEATREEYEKAFSGCSIPIGLKLPPYTYASQFDDVTEVINRFNGEGFGRVSTESDLNATTSDARTSAANMVATSIDPTLLSQTDADEYVSDVPSELFSRISLSEALDARARDAASLTADLTAVRKHPLDKLLQYPGLRMHKVFSDPWPISFVTSTNTLGSSLLMKPDNSESGFNVWSWRPQLGSADGSGIGGLGGALLHPLALGNIANLRKRLQPMGGAEITIIGVGGVCDAEGYRRMRSAGADRVALATALGARGVGIFEEITRDGLGEMNPARAPAR